MSLGASLGYIPHLAPLLLAAGVDVAGISGSSSINTLIVTAAVGYLGWQFRKVVNSNEQQAAKLVSLEIAVRGDGYSVPGMSGDVGQLARKVEKLSNTFNEAQENRSDTMQEWSIWRRGVDDTLTSVTQGRYAADNRAGSVGRRKVDLLGTTQLPGDETV